MGRLHIYFVVIAVLISLLVHLFIINAAYQVTIKLSLFDSTRTAEEMFHIKTVERPERKPWRKSGRPEERIALERPDERTGRSEADLEDRRLMLAKRGLVPFDASEAEIDEALRKLFEAETLEADPSVRPELTAGKTVAQEVIAVEETIAGERIEVGRHVIDKGTRRGWATRDVYVPDETASPGEVLEKLVGTGIGPSGGDPDGFGPREDTMLDRGATIPTIIKPPTTGGALEIDAAELEDVVAEPVRLIRKYPPLDELLAVRMLTYHAPDEPDGYFMLIIEPRRDRSEFDIIAKDIIFVVDSSSSIRPTKLASYAEGLQRCVKALNPRDRFDLIEFKTTVRRMGDRLVPATRKRVRTAGYFLESLKSSGNTDVYQAVQGLVGVRPDPDRPYIIFLVTDGRANRGVVQNRNIINKVAEINADRAAIYSFAGGSKFNEYLLDLLSYRNKGESRFERRSRDIPDALYGFYQEVRDPILLNLRYQMGALDTAEVYPKVLPDFFLKSRVTVCGRYRDEKEFSVQLLGEVNGTTKEFIFKQSFDRPDNGNAVVARQWAFHKIYHLIGQMVAHGEDPATIAEIRALGAKHDIQTPYYE